jgi:hypothetical protein
MPRNPFAPPPAVVDHDQGAARRQRLRLAVSVAITAGLISGALMQWVDDTRNWPEPARLFLPGTVYGIAVMVIAKITSPALGGGFLLLLLLANTIGFLTTGMLWELLHLLDRSGIVDPNQGASATIAISLLCSSVLIGFVPVPVVLWRGGTISVYDCMKLVAIGTILGVVAVVITALDIPGTTRSGLVFTTMVVWQSLLLTAQARLQHNWTRIGAGGHWWI